MDVLKGRTTRKIYSVQELTSEIKSVLEEGFVDLWVRGEISNCKKAASGHMYFTLKDETSVIKAVLFRGYQRAVRFEAEDGLKVIVHGSINVFEKRGEYQIIVDIIEPEGIGALQLAFEQLKEKLLKEGLFDESHKQTIPAFPDTVGIITSPTGAALRDILNVTERRYKGIKIIIYPVLVQGEHAAGELAAAIKKANERKETDVLIVGRGGGSIEDLWSFNEEIVARAIYESQIPIISAVGHEIDYTISDFVADLRAPTPSAAAELVVKNKEELLNRAKELIFRLYNSADRLVSRAKERVSYYSEELLIRRIQTVLYEKNMILDDMGRSLSIGLESILTKQRSKFEKAVGKLSALSPLNTLARGFAMVSKLPENTPVFTVADVTRGDQIATRLKDGSLISDVHRIEKNECTHNSQGA
jgi:exodeoxyribonuclease VII large subunit